MTTDDCSVPGPFSRKMTFESGKILGPLICISSPPEIEALMGLKFSMWGSSRAARWAEIIKEKIQSHMLMMRPFAYSNTAVCIHILCTRSLQTWTQTSTQIETQIHTQTSQRQTDSVKTRNRGVTYSTPQQLRLPAMTVSSHWPGEYAHGKWSAHVCSFVRCLFLPFEAQYLSFEA